MPTAEQTIAALSMPFNPASVTLPRCAYCGGELRRNGRGWAHNDFSYIGASLHTATPVGAPCDFCHGEPVRNAADWIALGGPETLPCPRCGETNT